LPADTRAVLAGLLALALALALTPQAIRVARRTGFLDKPYGYKGHKKPTPYLGGTAVVLAFVIAAMAFETDARHYAAIAACAVFMCMLGTWDDRRPISPRTRVAVEVVAVGGLVAAGGGWDFLSSGFEQWILTAAWIVAFTNSFNLMDNQDGAAGAVGASCGAALVAAGFVLGSPALGIFAAAVTGACLGFLRFNLRPGKSARVFLGDGGSIAIGFTLAALATEIPVSDMGWPRLLGAAVLLGLPVLDTMLVVVSRTRRGVALATGGRDHLTHRLKTRLHTNGRVAITLALMQLTASAAAIAALEYGRTAVIATALTGLVVGWLIVQRLDGPAWAPRPRPIIDPL
jgi:UDP-GlcNAc:undecaprenyl-phosphate GlcNAc-1-phosphate transferase